MCVSVGLLLYLWGAMWSLYVQGILRGFFYSQDSHGWPRAFNFFLLVSLKSWWTLPGSL